MPNPYKALFDQLKADGQSRKRTLRETGAEVEVVRFDQNFLILAADGELTTCPVKNEARVFADN